MEKSPSDPVVYVNPDTQNVFRKFLNFVGKDSKRTIAGLAVLVIVAAVPLTVFISQQRQETRQRASGTCTTYCTELFQCGACDVTQGKLCAMEYQSCDGTVNKVPVACQTAVEPSTCSLTPPATTLTPPTLPLSATIALTSEGQANGDPYKFQTSVQGQSLSIAEIYVQNKSFTGNADSWGCKGEVNQKWCLIQRKTYNGQSQDTFQSQWVPPIAGEFQAVVNVQTSSGAKCTGQNPMPVETTWKYCGTGSDVSFTATGTGTGTGPGTGGSTDLSLSKLEVSPITPNSLDPLSVSVAGTGNTIKIFLHDSGAPAKSDGITYDYNPQEVQPHTFYYWGQASAPAGINTIATNVINISHVPNIATTYAVYANVYTQDGNKICAWDGLIYTKAADGKFNSDGTTCPTAKATFSVLQDGTLGGDLSIDSLVVNPETAAPKADVRIFAQGQGGTVKVYFHGTNNPTVNDPLSSPYNPDNVVNNIFYYIGGLSSTIKAPAQPGTYYVAANLVAQSPTYGDTSQTICAWNGKVYKVVNNQTTQTTDTCTNPGPKTLTVSGQIPSGTVTQPTNTPTPTGGRGGLPTNTPTPTTSSASNPTNTPTPTPTPTLTPGGTRLAFNLIFSGIGPGRGNSNPVHTTRNLTVCIYDSTVDPTNDNNCNKAVLKKTGTVNYNSSSGTFANSNFDLGQFNGAGKLYQILVKSDKYLRKRVPQFITINTGQTNNVPQVTLIVGDINGDNVLDILDYNIYLSCYDKKAGTASCPNKDVVDLNDDGKTDIPTDMNDFRLLFASFSVQRGD